MKITRPSKFGKAQIKILEMTAGQIHLLWLILGAASAFQFSGINLNGIQLPLYRRVPHSDIHVAFSAGLTHNLELHSPINITYDRVFLNQGGGYNNGTGVFSCPHGGAYVFMFHGISDSDGQLWLDLMKNGEYMVSGYAHQTQDYASASNAILLSLEENDRVTIQGRGDNWLYNKPDEVYATFSGFLLYPDNQNP